MPTAVVLLQWMGVGGWGCPISSKVSQIMFASIALRKRAASSALAADVEIHFNIVERARMVPLGQMGHPSVGRDPRKNIPRHVIVCRRR